MPYLRHYTKILDDDTPGNVDVVGNAHTVVPSDHDDIDDEHQQWHCFVIVSQANGVTSPTTDVIVETSFDGGTNWARVGSATQLTADGSETELIELKAVGPRLRARKQLGGGTKPDSTAVVYLASNGLVNVTDTGA